MSSLIPVLNQSVTSHSNL
uniref:Uncharacterized protein n=1 Tax=Rhizophora mucronata TaxID=61149 RepID=A0A2P2QGQ4_RHIMU